MHRTLAESKFRLPPLTCCSACRLDADKHGNPLILLDLGGSQLDADQQQITLFDSDGSRGEVSAQGFLCTSASSITEHVIATLDGGRAALRLRYQKYGVANLDDDG